MAVKLHCCSAMWVRIDAHPCWRVKKALDAAGVEYTVEEHARHSQRRPPSSSARAGQRTYPVIEFEDGAVYREESSDMAARIRAGRLREAEAPGDSTPASSA